MNPFLFWGLLVAAAAVAEILYCRKRKFDVQMIVFLLVTGVFLWSEDDFDKDLIPILFVGSVAAQLISELVIWFISFIKKRVLSRKNT